MQIEVNTEEFDKLRRPIAHRQAMADMMMAMLSTNISCTKLLRSTLAQANGRLNKDERMALQMAIESCAESARRLDKLTMMVEG